MSRPSTRSSRKRSITVRFTRICASGASASNTPRLLVPITTGQKSSAVARGMRHRSTTIVGASTVAWRKSSASAPGAASVSAGLMRCIVASSRRTASQK